MKTQALVIGGGPAGLMAAEVMAKAGLQVMLCEAKPSLGRKLLMAGKSGLNLTKAEPLEQCLKAYAEARPWLTPMLSAFGPDEVMAWAEGLGQRLFTGSTGRVFPEVMKASPLLRAWLARLAGLGVRIQTRWRWSGWADGMAQFDTPGGAQSVASEVIVLALGGASWSRLGSDGAWVAALGPEVPTAAFAPSNAALRMNWSQYMQPHFGAPIKGVCWTAGGMVSRGEATISPKGIEGGGIYTISRALRHGAKLTVDLTPDKTAQALAAMFKKVGNKQSLANKLRKASGLDPAKRALIQELGRPLPPDPDALARLIKTLPVPYTGLAPLDEAISTAGGVMANALDGNLMLRAKPGVFCAGEMLDWEAPTGGYLLTACLATGRWAGLGAVHYLR